MINHFRCGVGGSLPRGTTTSPRALNAPRRSAGRRALADAGLDDRVRCREGDFLDHPDLDGTADLVLSIGRSCTDPTRGLLPCGGAVAAPGGGLAICDGVLTDAGAAAAMTRRRLTDFRDGGSLARHRARCGSRATPASRS